MRSIPMLACMGIIFFLSHQPGDSLALPPFPGADKLAHLAAYGLLSATVIFAFTPAARRRRPALVALTALLVPLLYGLGDEYHQRWVAGRSAELLDLAADGVGAVLISGWWYAKKKWGHN